jgi:hypothetical protein
MGYNARNDEIRDSVFRSPHYFFLGPSILLSTIFRASANASAGVEHGFVMASRNLRSACVS